jgi:hypothetical protein
MGVWTMNTRPNRSTAIKDNLLFILVFNVFFWVLAVVVSVFQLFGQQSFERVFPVVVGGTCVALVAVISAWMQRRNRYEE